MKVTDMIAAAILAALENQDGTAEIQRNELASRLGCVPSQISYVITSRFTPEQGYVVESRRGGGGYIRISRVQVTAGQLLMHVINSIGERIDNQSVRMILENLVYQGAIDQCSAGLILCAASDNALRAAPPGIRDALRASLLKQMLTVLAANQ